MTTKELEEKLRGILTAVNSKPDRVACDGGGGGVHRQAVSIFIFEDFEKCFEAIESGKTSSDKVLFTSKQEYLKKEIKKIRVICSDDPTEVAFLIDIEQIKYIKHKHLDKILRLVKYDK